MDIEELKHMFRYKYQADDFAVKYQSDGIEIKHGNEKKGFIFNFTLMIFAFILIIFALVCKLYWLIIIAIILLLFEDFTYKLHIKSDNQILYITKKFKKYKINFSDIITIRKTYNKYSDIPDWGFFKRYYEYETLEIFYNKNGMTRQIRTTLKHNVHTIWGEDKISSYDMNIENINKLLNFFLTKDDILLRRKEGLSNYISIENKDDYYEEDFNSVENVIRKKEEENCYEFILKNEKYYLCDIIKKSDYNSYKKKISKDFDLSKIMFLQSEMLGKSYLKIFVQENEILANKEKLKSRLAINKTERIARIILIIMAIFLLSLVGISFICSFCIIIKYILQ